MSSHQPPWTPIEEETVQTPAKFSIGNRVRWFRVTTQDFGTVVNRFYSAEGSVQALGWHYQVQLHSDSPSFAHCREDYGFEDDLERMEQRDFDEID